MTQKTFATACILILLTSAVYAQTKYYQFVDPLIGTEGQGNVIVGPSCPFGMIKPGPDNAKNANNGYNADLSLPIFGFSQVHVSGTGGGAKYGNISVMPFNGALNRIKQTSTGQSEVAALGYYSVLLKKGNILTEITTSDKVAIYRFTYNKIGANAVKLDAGEFFNEGFSTDAHEAQFFVGSEIKVLSDREVCGYNRIRGGWNAGGVYTVYFHAIFDQPFFGFKTWKANKLYPNQKAQFDSGEKTGVLLSFKSLRSRKLQMKIGISFISTDKADENIANEIPGWKFKTVLKQTQMKWEQLLSRIEIDKQTSRSYKRMFYTSLYHSMLMPVDRTGENPSWKSTLPYYDDFYAIWDTYRSSHPLLTLVDPNREVNIVNSLLNIYQHEGYMPDARSGNSNGRTQCGSNAEVLIADAYVKGLKGIDYELALKAMLKDADVPPGGNEEQQGRGGLYDYKNLGYVSSAYPRAGTRTVEYAFDDYCIAVVAKGMGKTAEFDRFSKQAGNWKNLWRYYTDHGATGFIMPKNEEGHWVDSIKCTVPPYRNIAVTPTYINSGQCEDWWSGFIYESNPWEYSLSIPHDVAGLIKLSGGKQPFQTRLDTFFFKHFYNVGNEPAFLTPMLYHWIGKPELSSERILNIIQDNYSDLRNGIPGNDDSGAMSSWLAFHMLGIYPNAGQSYYLIHTPLLAESILHLSSGKDFKIKAKNLSKINRYIKGAKINGVTLARDWLEHSEIESGGILELEMSNKPSAWGSGSFPPSMQFK
ncbi:GH92 family glycosyl hydrolase [Mucilaginibacter flavidus]|uniref:GH92 family glycosyl hydrolase n=1 Tax=Mucilaginibacter flavidus TaxID=2949309 RepID=UPI0020923849|nr:GH92 family glycosyl hydrolase [Mucilaginibacter flavidus]MCO5949365.1 GH92 family glycosyl hydrolase [Mucilaginibacter flavidus]